jgi:arginyl-tRNA synthetase
MKLGLSQIVSDAIRRAQRVGEFTQEAVPQIQLEYPRDEEHGDYATNIAMIMASQQKRPPRDVAEIIIRHLQDEEGSIERVEVAGPGFINFFLSERHWHRLLSRADREGNQFGAAEVGAGMRVLVEFPSANPTGPLHIGHGRIAAVGDVVSNLLERVGYNVDREYYVNDTGTQVELLGSSVAARYLQELGRPGELPPEGYQGEYIKDIARSIKDEEGERLLELSDQEVVVALGDRAKKRILDSIRDDLERFRVRFDRWFGEQTLYDQNLINPVLEELTRQKYLYEREGALWFRSTVFGDEKDRVVIRANGSTTYFASDIAYHRFKFDRGYDLLVNVWGADHHGYIPRMEAAIQALGFDKTRFKVVLVQLVTLLRGGVPVTMSTRAGEFTSLQEVMDEVGEDACRYFFMLRRADTPLDFDLELATQKSTDNPVYYVQYAHARISSIFKKAAKEAVDIPTAGDVDFSRLNLPEERALIKHVARYPELVEGAATALEPQRLTAYLQDLSGLFHSYYNKHRVISDDTGMTDARLLLVKAIRHTLRNSLTLLGVRAPEEM